MKTRFVLVLGLLFTLSLPLLAQSQTLPETLTPDNASQIDQMGRIRQPSARRVLLGFTWSPDGTHLAMATDKGVQTIDFETESMRPGQLYGNTDLTSVAYSPDNKLLAAGNGLDGAVFIWNAATADQVAAIHSGDEQTEGVVFSPDGKLLAVRNFNENVTLWGVWSNGERQLITASNAYQIQNLATFLHESGASDMQFNADGSLLATVSSADDMLQVWNTVSEERVISRQLSGLRNADFSPDGRYLALTIEDVGIMLMDGTTFEEVRTIPVDSPELSVTDLSFSPNSTLIATSVTTTNRDHLVKIWDVESGELLNVLTNHPSTVWRVAFNPSGTILASLGWDDGIRLWGLGGEIATLAAPTATPAPTLTATPVPMLEVGGRARVNTTGGDALNVRNNPSRQGELLAKLENNTLVSIVDGPQESDGLIWWKVSTENGLEGWVVEAVDGEQTLIPAP